MKKVLSIVLTLVLIMTGVVSVFGEEKIVELTYDFNDFDSLYVDRAFTVELTQGDEYSVIVKADETIKDKLDVHQEGSKLVLSVKENENIINKKYEAYVVVPDLKSIENKSASQITGTLNVNELNIIVDSAATVTLKGSVETIKVNAQHAAEADLKGMTTKTATVEALYASSVSITANDQVNAKAKSASTITIYGQAKVEATADISSTIETMSDNNVEEPVVEEPIVDEPIIEEPNQDWNFENPFEQILDYSDELNAIMAECDAIQEEATKEFEAALKAYENAMKACEKIMEDFYNKYDY